MEPLADIFNLDLEKNNGDWLGNSNNIYSSSCANSLNIEPQQLTFTPDTIPVYIWFKDETFNLDGDISVQAFINYLAQAIVERGYPLTDIQYRNDNKLDNLLVDITLNNNNTIQFIGI